LEALSGRAQGIDGIVPCAGDAFSAAGLLLFRIQNSTRRIAATSTANPLTAPPTIAPTGAPFESGEAVGVMVAVEVCSDVDVVKVRGVVAAACAVLPPGFVSQGEGGEDTS